MVQGCTFREDAPQIKLDEGVRKAVITGNIVKGAIRIDDQSKNAAIANNVGDRHE